MTDDSVGDAHRDFPRGYFMNSFNLVIPSRSLEERRRTTGPSRLEENSGRPVLWESAGTFGDNVGAGRHVGKCQRNVDDFTTAVLPMLTLSTQFLFLQNYRPVGRVHMIWPALHHGVTTSPTGGLGCRSDKIHLKSTQISDSGRVRSGWSMRIRKSTVQDEHTPWQES